MSIDPAILERNRIQLARLRQFVPQLSEADLNCPVGDGWTVAVVLVHVAFWDRRALLVLEYSERDGAVWQVRADEATNDVALPFWLAIPPHEAVRLALTCAEVVQGKIEHMAQTTPELLEQVAAFRARYVERAIHWADHLDQIERALKA